MGNISLLYDTTVVDDVVQPLNKDLDNIPMDKLSAQKSDWDKFAKCEIDNIDY